MTRKWSRKKKTSVAVAIAGLATGLGAMLLWPRIRNVFFSGRITAKKPVLTAQHGVSLVDPCPGNYQIWDAETGRCIPLIEE